MTSGGKWRRKTVVESGDGGWWVAGGGGWWRADGGWWWRVDG